MGRTGGRVFNTCAQNQPLIPRTQVYFDTNAFSCLFDFDSNMMNLKLILTTCSAPAWRAFCRPSHLNGRVTDEQGQPLPSATVMNASAGVFTDLDGNYTLSVASENNASPFPSLVSSTP